MATEDVELCSGCGSPGPHAMVGVTRDDETGKMAEFPVCDACHQNPEHRQRTLKMHFFSKSQARVAVDAAEKMILQGVPTEEQRRAQEEWKARRAAERGHR